MLIRERDSRLLVALFVGLTMVLVGLTVWSVFIEADGREIGSTRGFIEPLGGVLSAVLGIVITVVAIVVQLAAQRYTPKVVDLFMRDRTTQATFGLMVVSCIYVMLAPLVAAPHDPWSMPVILSVLLGVVNLGLLMPYFQHVFRFLQPSNIINLIEMDAHQALGDASGAGQARAQARVADAIERIADTGLTSMLQHDRNLAVDALYKLDDLTCHYLNLKKQLPPDWRRVDRQHFMASSPRVFERITQEGVWVEVKALDELTHMGRTAFREMPDLAPQIGVVIRSICVSAIRNQDDAALLWTLRYAFTLLRHAINSSQARACFDLLLPIRETGHDLLKERASVVTWLMKRYSTYAVAAVQQGLPLVAETLAHDLRVTLVAALEKDSDVAPRLADCLGDQVDALLGVPDCSPDAAGVGALIFAAAQARDLQGESALARACVERLDASIAEVPGRALSRSARLLLASESPDYWEATHRGEDYRYVPHHLRAEIASLVEPRTEERR